MIALLEILERTDSFLKKKGVASPRLDAELLLGHVLGMTRLEVYMNFERPVMDSELDALRPFVTWWGAAGFLQTLEVLG